MKRLTSAKRMRVSLIPIRRAQLHRLRDPIPMIGRWLRRVIQGCFNYHAVPGRGERLDAFRKDVCRAWLHPLINVKGSRIVTRHVISTLPARAKFLSERIGSEPQARKAPAGKVAAAKKPAAKKRRAA